MRRAEEISKCIGKVLSKSEGVKRKLKKLEDTNSWHKRTCELSRPHEYEVIRGAKIRLP